MVTAMTTGHRHIIQTATAAITLAQTRLMRQRTTLTPLLTTPATFHPIPQTLVLSSMIMKRAMRAATSIMPSTSIMMSSHSAQISLPPATIAVDATDVASADKYFLRHSPRWHRVTETLTNPSDWHPSLNASQPQA